MTAMESKKPTFKSVALPPSVLASLGVHLVNFGFWWLMIWGVIALMTSNDGQHFRRYARELRAEQARLLLHGSASTEAGRLRATAEALDLETKIASVEAKASAADAAAPGRRAFRRATGICLAIIFFGLAVFSAIRDLRQGKPRYKSFRVPEAQLPAATNPKT